jgi:hypothetical protein
VGDIIELPNGASVMFDPNVSKWAIFAGAGLDGVPPGSLLAYRREKEAALAQAAALECVPLPPPPSAPRVELSPTADPELRASLNARPAPEAHQEAPHYMGGGGRTRAWRSGSWQEMERLRKKKDKDDRWWAKANPRLHPKR